MTETLDWEPGVHTSGQHKTLHGEALLGALAPRARPGERAEDVLIDLGMVDDRDFALQLALRSGRSMVGLRKFTPDERLFLYLPVAIAQRERVCPLVLV